MSASALRCIFQRFGEDPQVREALLARGGLPVDLRVDIACATAKALTALVAGAGWLDPRRAEQIAREACEQSLIAIAGDCAPGEVAELVEALRRRRLLTVALLMRGLLSGDLELFEATLANLARAPTRRVAGFVRRWGGPGFGALYLKAGLPSAFLPAFRAALAALWREAAPAGGGVSHALTMRVIEECRSAGRFRARACAFAAVALCRRRRARRGARLRR